MDNLGTVDTYKVIDRVSRFSAINPLNIIGIIKAFTAHFISRVFSRYVIHNEQMLSDFISMKIASNKQVKVKILISEQLPMTAVIDLLDQNKHHLNVGVEFATISKFDPKVYLLLTNRSIHRLGVSFKTQPLFNSRKYILSKNKIDKELTYLNFSKLKAGIFDKSKMSIMVPVLGDVLYLNSNEVNDLVPIYHNDMVVVFYNKKSIHKCYNRILPSIPFINSDLFLEYNTRFSD